MISKCNIVSPLMRAVECGAPAEIFHDIAFNFRSLRLFEQSGRPLLVFQEDNQSSTLERMKYSLI